ncbi:hypothetical protein LPJ53_005211 [Coemansia erecta]|uniref:Kinesin motor domain-containing protein n=1 Tax=Coemansia erecta TaxID=147472 RepID=A0A9W7XSX2_9FUNG|nr:hypothetical protein LPJ53_005211 [Coemansia erecta]
MRRLNSGAEKEKDACIQVVVRCRDAPMRQLKNNTTILVHPVHGQDVMIDGPASVARTYQYDGVFGPRATQERIYDKVVRPILDEVMQGYNCTIFAYGQTGTGKTYTMEGDLNGADTVRPSHMSPEAGIIPRTLHNLFDELNSQTAEYTVHVSYAELYNEKVHDLLARDGASNGFGNKLKVVKSKTDKGATIQGLEDRLVINARDAVAALQEGALRRRVAATRCNDTSSRSHAIFTIMVSIRERTETAEGDEIVKLSKLNLVDLAGSENIGRSGAQDERVREASTINRSLLSLGCVIRSLVRPNTHTSYRDSKLTRILQDSLGGGTRTCMIATISNSAENIEETIGTLQYASEARGIVNHLLANTKVSKSEKMHTMELEIEQLRRDLDAARDGTGYFITRESHAEFVADKRKHAAAINEWRQRIAEADEKEAELADQLAERDAKLAVERAELAKMQTKLINQELLTRAHQHHEHQLHGVAQGLHSALSLASNDTSLLHTRLARMAQQEAEHTRMTLDAARQAGEDGKQVVTKMQEHADAAAQNARDLAASLQQQLGSAFDQAVRGQLGALKDAMHMRTSEISKKAHADAEDARALVDAALDAISVLTRELEAVAQKVLSACNLASDEFAQALRIYGEQQHLQQREHLDHMRQMFDAHVGRLGAMHGKRGKHRMMEFAELAEAVQQMCKSHAGEVAELKRWVSESSAMKETDHQKLLEHVARALADCRARDAETNRELVAGAERMAQSVSTLQQHVHKHCQMAAANSDEVLEEDTQATRQTFDEVTQATLELIENSDTHVAQLSNSLQVHHDPVRMAANDMVVGVVQVDANARQYVEEAHGRVGNMVQLVNNVTNGMGNAGVQATEDTMAAGCAALDKMKAAVADVNSRVHTQGNELRAMADHAAEGIKRIAAHVQSSTACIAATLSDDTVPPRHTYKAPECWQMTRNHAYILERQNTQSSEHLAWTGITVTPHDSILPEERSLSAFSVDAASGKTHEVLDGVAKVMHKRQLPNDAANVVTEINNEKEERSAKRSRTSQARVNMTSN